MTAHSIALREPGHVAAPHAHAPVLDFAGGSLRDKWQMAEMLAQSQLVPKDFRGKPGDILIVADIAASLALTVAQGLQTIACINGRPVMWGDGLKGVVYRSPFCEWIKETEIGVCLHCKAPVHRVDVGESGDLVWRHQGSNAVECVVVDRVDARTRADVSSDDDSYGYRCSAKRRGEPNIVVNEFTFGDAKRAGLLNKDGPWKTYGPRRMCRMRARSWTLRDAFPDVLKGLAMREEVVDIPSEVREAVVNAPTRTAALKAALEANAALAGATAIPVASNDQAERTTTDPPVPDHLQLAAVLDAAAASDPNFSKMDGVQIKAYVMSEAEKAGLKPWEVAEVAKDTEAGRLVRANAAQVLRNVRERAIRAGDGLPVAASAVTEADKTDDVPIDQADAKPGAETPDFSTMTSEQLSDFVDDAAFARNLPHPALNVILRAYAEGGLNPDNIVTVLAQIEKRGG